VIIKNILKSPKNNGRRKQLQKKGGFWSSVKKNKKMDQLSFLKLSVMPTHRLEHHFAVADIDTGFLLRQLKKQQQQVTDEHLTSLSLLILRRKDVIADLLRNLFPIARLD
jgi:hypothetical protein